MLISDNLSWFFVFVGIIFSALISFLSYKLKLIDKKTEFPFLQTQFYSHFLKIYFENLMGSIKLLMILAFTKRDLQPATKIIKIKESKINNSMLIATINLTNGLLCFDCNSDECLIYFAIEEYLKNFDFEKLLNSLKKVNDDDI